MTGTHKLSPVGVPAARFLAFDFAVLQHPTGDLSRMHRTHCEISCQTPHSWYVLYWKGAFSPLISRRVARYGGRYTQASKVMNPKPLVAAYAKLVPHIMLAVYTTAVPHIVQRKRAEAIPAQRGA
eukprot:2001982-Rhodomonas_salina.2